MVTRPGHFVRGLVGKRQCQYSEVLIPRRIEQPGDSTGVNACLTGTGTRENQHRAVVPVDGLTLDVSKLGESRFQWTGHHASRGSWAIAVLNAAGARSASL